MDKPPVPNASFSCEVITDFPYTRWEILPLLFPSWKKCKMDSISKLAADGGAAPSEVGSVDKWPLELDGPNLNPNPNLVRM